MSRGARVAKAVERELTRTLVPFVARPEVDRNLVQKLPPGFVERMLAIPLGRDRRTGVVDVACVDPSDRHLGRELAHQLESPVRLYRTSLSELLLAVDRWLDERDATVPSTGRTPAFGTRVARHRSVPPARLSLPPPVERVEPPPEEEPAPASSPIPLVRRPPVADRTRRRTNPGVGTKDRAELPFEHDEQGEPVIELFRSKPPPAPAPSQPVRIVGAPEATFEQALEALSAAPGPESVAELLAEGATSAASLAIVLAVRPAVYEGRAASRGVPRSGAIRSLRVPAGLASAFDTAAHSGRYLGALPDDAVHGPVRSLLGSDEVYLCPVVVSGRPVLLLALSGMPTSFEATRRADALAAGAGERLEAILRSKKKNRRNN